MADIKLKNTANTEFSISHNGTRGAKAVTSDQIVVAVETINDFPAIAETGDTVIVKDINRGGTFIYDATQSAVNNGGTIFDGWVRQYSGAVNVKWFGAKGDGITNDTLSIGAMSSFVSTLDSASVVIPSGTYMIGLQDFAGAEGIGYSYKSKPYFHFSNMSHISVYAEGAVIKYVDGLKFGSFDPVTGLSYTPVMPFYDKNYVADLSVVFLFKSCDTVSLAGYIEIDGNIQNTIKGGAWGDTGTQIVSYGILLDKCNNIDVSNVYTHHHCLDGISLKYSNLTSADITSGTISNVVSEYNARQGLSHVGGSNITYKNCKFSHTGKAGFGSSPGAGVDIENESSICRNLIFDNCIIENNVGAGFLALDTGETSDITIKNSRIVGSTSYSTWLNAKKIKVYSSTIVGASANNYFTSDSSLGTTFTECYITNEESYSNYGVFGTELHTTNNQSNCVYDKCTFVAEKGGFGRYDYSTLRQCNLILTAGESSSLNSGDSVIRVPGATLEDITIYDKVPSLEVPASPYYVNQGANTIIGRNEVVPNPANPITSIRWSRSTTGAGGHTGVFSHVGYQNADTPTKLTIANRGWSYYGFKSIMSSNEIPTTGDYIKGDIIFNTNVVAGGTIGWVCLASGTPGTWKAFGTIEA